VRERRKDLLHKVSHRLTAKADVLKVETLSVADAGMARLVTFCGYAGTAPAMALRAWRVGLCRAAQAARQARSLNRECWQAWHPATKVIFFP